MLWLPLGAVFIVVIFVYNSLMQRRNQVDFAFATVDALLKQRHDLIPALLETSQAHARHERELLQHLTALRAQHASSHTLQGRNDPQRLHKENLLEHNLHNVLVWLEAYPELQAQQSFRSLQQALIDNEAQIAAARRFYNAAVNDYNDSVRSFPSNLLAQALGWQRKPYFQLSAAERSAPRLASKPTPRSRG